MSIEQERRHWLMKTDKNKTVQDIVTGDLFRGRIDNLGSDIIVETEKLPEKDTVVQNAKIESDAVARVLQTETASLPFIPKMGGLLMERLISINLSSDTEFIIQNFRLILKDCETIYVPIASPDTGEVFTYQWLKTSTAPILEAYNPDTEGTEEYELTFAEGVTNPIFYYPLDEALQPIDIELDDGNYVTPLITDDDMIGLPLIWLNCDESNVGPKSIVINNETADVNGLSQVFEVGCYSKTKYTQALYPCTGTYGYNVPTSISGDAITNNDDFVITCTSDAFTGDASDLSKPIQSISFVKIEPADECIITFSEEYGNNRYCMAENTEWEYDASTKTYSIPLSTFDTNCISESTHAMLLPAFIITMDPSIRFDDTTTDIGYAGISFGSSKNYFDQYPRYPHDIEKMEGLPDWIKQTDDSSSPQHLSIYAIHNTPNYNPDDQNTRQIAGLIFDPGNERTYDSETTPNDEIGRVYYLSNDDIEYRNNAKISDPKPPRTIARICDIPTSVMQLSGIHGIAPISIVDKKYTRSEAPFSEASLNRLYNTCKDKWVKPTHYDSSGIPIYTPGSTTQSNQFIFDSVANLNRVDLWVHNDFRAFTNLNATIDPSNDVELFAIYERGTGYSVGDIGTCVVGGFAFNYEVTEISDDGEVMSLLLAAGGDGQSINLSNFDMAGESDHTNPYGTSPIENNTGTGLKIQFRIKNYFQRLPQKTTVVDGLYAFVRDIHGIWLYQYNNVTRHWDQSTLIAEANVSDPVDPSEGISVKAAYINSVIPSIRELPVSLHDNNHLQQTIRVLQTSTFINVIDDTKTPVWIPNDSGEGLFDDRTVVDINRFYCNQMGTADAESKTASAVIKKINDDNIACFDTLVFWRWVYPNDQNNKTFEYGVIHRSFNNLMSNGSTSMLPNNELTNKRFVHSNPSTTIVWNVPHVGPMMWIYDPTYKFREKYYIDANTRELYVIKEDLNLKNVEVYLPNGGTISLVDESGQLRYNILTNNPSIVTDFIKDEIYQQPQYRQFDDSMIGARIPTAKPIGNWRLIFPEIHTFRLVGNGKEYFPTKMQIIRGASITPDTDIMDYDNQPVNYKTLLVDESDKVNLKLYNQLTGSWDTI